MGLSEVILLQHGVNGPNTHNHGQNPIDGIFLPTNLIQSASGHFAFGKGIPSNHQALWINQPLVVLGWFNTPELVPLRARWLKCNDPCIIHRYNEELQEKLSQQQLPHCIETLTKQANSNHLTQKQQCKYKALDTLNTAAKLYAESKCCKLTVRQVAWCP